MVPLELQQRASVTHWPPPGTDRQVGTLFLHGFIAAAASSAQMVLPADLGGRHPKSVEQHRSSPKHRNVADGAYDWDSTCPSDGPHREHYQNLKKIIVYTLSNIKIKLLFITE